jgi:hypothetical protein
MTFGETILAVLVIALVVVGAAIVSKVWERRKARELVEPLITRSCPQCGEAFGPGVLATAHELHHGFYDPLNRWLPFGVGPIWPTVNLVCPRCSTRWKLCGEELSKIPA